MPSVEIEDIVDEEMRKERIKSEKNMVSAATKIYDILLPLEPAARIRVLRAVAILFDIELEIRP